MPHLMRSFVVLILFAVAALAQTPKVGERAKDFTLPTAKGGSVTLGDYAGKSKVVLVFYRGYWCPFCRKQLTSLAANYDKYKAAGAEVIAISVDPPDKSLKLSEQLKLPFPVLSDIGHKVIDSYNILDKGGEISTAAVFVLDQKGTVRWSYVAADYKIRPLDETLLEELAKP